MRCSPKVSEVLPLLYLPRLYSGDFTSASREFFGSEAGLSPVTAATSPSNGKRNAARSWSASSRRRTDVYIWVDGIHTKFRLGHDNRPCCLVTVGRGWMAKGAFDGSGRLPGVRRVEDRAAAGPQKRGRRTPVLAVVDGASGFWGRAPSDHPFLIKVIA